MRAIISDRSYRNRLVLASLLGGTALGAPAPAFAQIAPGNSGADSTAVASDTGLGDIIVTAQKRAESLQRAAIAADVITGSDLTTKHIDNLQALQLATPSLSVGDAGVTSSVNIRGIGLGVSSPAVVSGVAVYRDGLFQPPILASEPFFDLARVEVLRGPQGTFVGSSSTGGAIFYNSVDPTLSGIEGYLSGGYGNYDDVKAQGAVNVPLSGTLAARFAFNVESRDSFFRQDGTARQQSNGRYFEQPGNLNERNFRVGIKWQPADNLTVLTKTALNYNNTDGFAHVMSSDNPYYDGRPLEYRLSYNADGTLYNEKGIRQSVQVDFETSKGITIRSISGYNDIHVRYVDDFDSSSFPGSLTKLPAITTFTNGVREWVASQEFNIISPKGQRLEWVVGAFYFYDYALADFRVDEPNPPTSIISTAPSAKQAIAGFGQLGYALTPALRVQAGLRYTQSYADTTGSLTLLGIAPVPVVIDQGARERDNAWTGKVTVNWTISPQQFAYAFAAKGYKAGGINGPGVANFAPETVWDYEAGLKSSFFGNRIRTQINGFYMKYKNLQLTGYIPPASGPGGANGVINAGSSDIYGVELQSQAKFGGLSLDANLSYVHSKIGSANYISPQLIPGTGNVPLGPQCAGGATTGCFDYTSATLSLSGNRNPYSPELTLNLGAQYKFAVNEKTSLTPRVDYTHISGQYQTIQNSNVGYGDFIPSHDIVNFRLVLENGPWQAEAYVTNLSNKLYVVGYTYGPGLFLGRPRQYGFTITRSF